MTNVNCNGVGWSWIDGDDLTVEKTEFQEILHDGIPGDVKKSIVCSSSIHGII